MKPYTLKNACKGWTIEEIGDSIFSTGMAYMNCGHSDLLSKEFLNQKHTLIKELKSRYKK